MKQGSHKWTMDKIGLCLVCTTPGLILPFHLLPHHAPSGNNASALQGINCVSYLVQWKDWPDNQFPLCLDAWVSVPPLKVNSLIAHFSWHSKLRLHSHWSPPFPSLLRSVSQHCSVGRAPPPSEHTLRPTGGWRRALSPCAPSSEGGMGEAQPGLVGGWEAVQLGSYSTSLHPGFLCMGIKGTMEKLTHGKLWNCLTPQAVITMINKMSWR